MLKKTLLLLLFFSCFSIVKAQTKKVLFIGNSYTGVNNLPQLIKDIALSQGDSLIFETHIPGGSRLMDHSSNPAAIAKIYSNNWDHVVIQGQSQEPSWDSVKVANEVFAHAKILADTIRANDSCTKPIFYMTWGRENGDAGNCATRPWVCTYEGMDSVLNKNYRQMAADNNGIVSPVGALWKYLRSNNPSIQLYAADGSHPSTSGSYAAALSFYSVIFKKNPSLVTYDFNLPATEALIIRNAAKLVVYDSLLKWGLNSGPALSSFRVINLPVNPTYSEVHFINQSQNADWFEWDFGDGTPISTEKDPIHFYTANGTFQAVLKAWSCSSWDSSFVSVQISYGFSLEKVGVNNKIKVFPKPSMGKINIDYPLEVHLKKIELVNSLGHKVKYYGKFDVLDSIDLSEMKSGQYFLLFYLDDGYVEFHPIQLID